MSAVKKPLAVLVAMTFFFGCGEKNMGWVRRPIFQEDYMHTFALAMTDEGNGFLGASIMSKAIFIEKPNLKKAMAMETAIIQETRDEWVTRSEAFKGSGEINSLHHLDSGRLLAVNSRVDLESLQESTHFIRWNGAEWKDVSSLPFEVVLVFANGGACVLTAAYPEDRTNAVILNVSLDGGDSWSSLTLGGMDPLDIPNRDLMWMDAEGLFYAIPARTLEVFELPKWNEKVGWKTVHVVPENFDPKVLNGDAEGIYTVGRLPDKALAIWKVPKTGSPTLVRAKGLPDTLQPERLWVHNRLLRITGTQEMTNKNGETTGYRNWLFESKDDGATWRDMGLPITGSIGAITFGEDGRIWVMAAGNRMQVYHP